MRPARAAIAALSLLLTVLAAACGGGSTPATCATAGLTCVHGACDDTGGAPRCACDAGWGGADCATCTATTGTLTGTVYAPQGTDPVANALVYVPGAAVLPFSPGVACERCSAAPSGAPVASARTGADGTFTLAGVPAGASQPLVVQVGRWRRQVAAPAVTACGTSAVAAGLTRLPRSKAEGDLPKIAVVTGAADGVECVLRKMGVADSEFTASSGTGRVHLFTGDAGTGSGGAQVAGSLAESALLGTAATLGQYDAVLLGCQGVPDNRTAQELQNVRDYVDAGGRLLITHTGHPILSANAPLSSTATWTPGQANPPDQTGFLDLDFVRGRRLSSWLASPAVGASAVAGQIPLQQLRSDVDAVVAPGRRWLSISDATQGVVPVLFGFDTPLGAAQDQTCGRVLFSDFHPAVTTGTVAGSTFPAACAGGGMTPQEKLLEFMLLDLGSCLEPDAP